MFCTDPRSPEPSHGDVHSMRAHKGEVVGPSIHMIYRRWGLNVKTDLDLISRAYMVLIFTISYITYEI